jgi:hypothetical protein
MAIDEGIDGNSTLVAALWMTANIGVVAVISVPALDHDHRLPFLSLLVEHFEQARINLLPVHWALSAQARVLNLNVPTRHHRHSSTMRSTSDDLHHLVLVRALRAWQIREHDALRNEWH